MTTLRFGKQAAQNAAPFPTVAKKKRRPPMDLWLLLLILSLFAFGSLMVFSASFAYAKTRFGDHFYFAKRQILWGAVGIPLMLAVSRLSAERIRRAAPYLFLGISVLLLLVPILGTEAGGAKRWLSLGPFSFQPSELAKCGLVLLLSYYFTEFQERVGAHHNKKRAFLFGIVIPFLIIGGTCFLVILEKHLSCTVILFAIGLAMMLLGGAEPRTLGGLCLAGGGGVGIFALAVEYTRRRIVIWRNPELYPTEGGWQTLQGMMAIGSGGFFGVGFGNSKLKYMYVSEPQNDFIFTIACEELGFLGALSILALFALFVARGTFLALRQSDPFSRLVTLGITCKVGIQALLNVAVVTNLLPNTGISLPFFSYGGSSLVMLFAEMGILLALSKNAVCHHS